MVATNSQSPHPRRFPWRWFWAGFLIILLAAVLLALFAGIRGTAQWAALQLEEKTQPPTLWSEVVQITLLGGETLHLDPAALPALQARTHDWIDQQEHEARQRLEQELDGGYAVLLDQALARVPRFADWYYSLQGEYARLFHAALGELPHFVAARMVEHVFEPAATAAGLDGLFTRLDQELDQELRMAAQEANSLLASMVRELAVEPEGPVELRVVESRSLGSGLSTRLEPHLGLAPEDLARQGAAASAGALAGVVAMKKLGLATAGKLGLKAAGGALAGAGGGAATGAALCGASVVAAPLVAGCALVGGIVAGIGTWVLVDKSALEAEEYLRRDVFEAELREAIRGEFEQLRAEAQMQYTGALRGGFTQLRRGLDELLGPTQTEPGKTFVPARGIGGQGD
ncbi:MAG TPA: hypothetical protein VLA26_02920 [Gammaproteobacteria bacterium]|nr:hypothetical protein [Gammaproteobacteria bacterium]